MPTAVPTMPDSASGLSMTRSSPKSFCRPSVMRKTPPSLPTSSPMMRTFGSSSIALRRPMLRPLASVIFVISVGPFERVEVGGIAVALLLQLVGHLGVHVVEDAQRRRVCEFLDAGTQACAEVVGLGVQGVEEVLVGQPVAAQVGLGALDRALEAPALDVVGEPVPRRVVGRGVRAHPVGV